jgi:hypothetical protein
MFVYTNTIGQGCNMTMRSYTISDAAAIIIAMTLTCLLKYILLYCQ